MIRTGKDGKHGVSQTIYSIMRNLFWGNHGHGLNRFFKSRYLTLRKLHVVLSHYLEVNQENFRIKNSYFYQFELRFEKMDNDSHDRGERHKIIVLGGLSTGSFIFIMIVLLRVLKS